MNETLQKIMTFINENTYILIGICIFLILVLIGYLIDNSVKSKRIRKDIKNKDQVPQNIKDDIIEEASKEKNINLNNNDTIKEKSLDIKSTIEKNDDLKENNIFQNNEINNLDIDNNLLSSDMTSDNINIESNPISVDIASNPNLENLISNNYSNEIDPDSSIMSQNDIKNKPYKNDKKLSEILLDMDKNSVDEISNTSGNIFNTDSLNVSINKDVEKNKVEIQPNNDDDELEKIMKKLSSMNNAEEDSYTNIF